MFKTITLMVTLFLCQMANAKPADPYLGMAKQATFRIGTKPTSDAIGTGFLLKLDGHSPVIVTNRHVCYRGTVPLNKLYIHTVDAMYFAEVLSVSDSTDLCMIRAPKYIANTVEPYRLAKQMPRIGGRVLTYGYRGGRIFTLGVGSYLRTAYEELQMNEPFPRDHMLNVGRVDFPVKRGQSGSPLLNREGDVIGVIFATEAGNSFGLFIPLEDLRSFIQNGAL